MFERNYLVIYDIKSNKNRRKVVKLLEYYGIRVQYSSFECNLNYTTKRTLIREISKIIEDEDSVRFYKMPDITEEINKPVQYNKCINKTVLI